MTILFYHCRHAVTVSFLNGGTSFLAGFAIFSIIGFMAHDAGVSVDEVITSGRTPWASYQIRKSVGGTCTGFAGTFSPAPRVSDPDRHQGTSVTHVTWCMPRSLTGGFPWSRWRENVLGFPGACATRNVTYLVKSPLPLLTKKIPFYCYRDRHY